MNKPIILHILLMLSFLSCSSTPRKPQGSILKPYVQFQDADFRETWFATLAAVKNFPIKIVDKNSGIIETDWVDYASDLYSETFGGDVVPQEGRFRIRIHVVEKFDAPKTRVSITKYDQIAGFLPGTFSDIPSNGTTENIMQYRIKRQIEMNRRLKSRGLKPLPIKTPQLEGVEKE